MNESEIYIDNALESLKQLRDCRARYKEENNDEWRKYWQNSCDFWIASIQEWLALAKEASQAAK